MNILNRLSNSPFFSSTLILILLITLYGFYAIGFGGIFSFDDDASLGGLLTITDWHSALLYISTGETGPLGRPLSLASFLINAPAYPFSAADFLYTNALIHLLNVCLVVLILVRLQRQIYNLLPQNPWFVPLTAVFWGMLPILVSTSMMVVQRMTSLSALFVLVGVWIYLWGRERSECQKSVILTVSGVGVCTLLAMLSKENGVLLPLYLVVLEFTLPSQAKPLAQTRSAQLLQWSIRLPSLFIVAYLLWQLPGLSSAYFSRTFTLSERIATQSIILWDYLRLSFIPQISALGPYHDDYPVFALSNLAVWIAMIAWLSALIWSLLRRRTYPVLAFAVLWYLAGHLLESTIIPLELYFEHRNYLPILGPVIALTTLAAQAPVRQRVKISVIAAYFGFMTFILWQTLSIWGHRELTWAQAHPNSVRAVQVLSQAYWQAGQPEKSLQILNEALMNNPKFSSVAMQSLRLRCYFDDRPAFAKQLLLTQQALGSSDYSHLTLELLEKIRQLHENKACHFIEIADLHTLTDLLISNPRFNSSTSMGQLHLIKAQLYMSEKQLVPTISHLEQSFDRKPDFNTALLLYAMLNNSGNSEQALQFLDYAASKLPKNNGLVHQEWLAKINQLKSSVIKR